MTSETPDADDPSLSIDSPDFAAQLAARAKQRLAEQQQRVVPPAAASAEAVADASVEGVAHFGGQPAEPAATSAAAVAAAAATANQPRTPVDQPSAMPQAASTPPGPPTSSTPTPPAATAPAPTAARPAPPATEPLAARAPQAPQQRPTTPQAEAPQAQPPLGQVRPAPTPPPAAARPTPVQPAPPVQPAQPTAPAQPRRAAAAEAPRQPQPAATSAPKPEPVLAGVGAPTGATGAQPVLSAADGPTNAPESVEPERVDGDDEYDVVNPKLRSLIEWAVVVAGALAVALVIKSFFLQAYFIPSPSMERTLVENDRVLVNKLSKSANRGDVMVFAREKPEPGQPADLIKRVIGLEGETVEARGGQMYIDGKLLLEPYLQDGIASTGPVWSDRCANERGDGNSCTVPEGHLFMMGDNRPNSSDSRVFGPISTDQLVGRAFLKVWPLGDITAL